MHIILYLELIISASKLKAIPKKRGWLRTLICVFPIRSEFSGSEISAVIARQISVHMFIHCYKVIDRWCVGIPQTEIKIMSKSRYGNISCGGVSHGTHVRVQHTAQSIKLKLPFALELRITLKRSFPSVANPHRLGAGPAMYAQALSSVSFMYTWQKLIHSVKLYLDYRTIWAFRFEHMFSEKYQNVHVSFFPECFSMKIVNVTIPSYVCFTQQAMNIYTPSVSKYKAPLNFAGQRLTTLTMISTYNMSTKLV